MVDLLRDANEEIRKGRKRTYPGAGKHSVPSIFSSQSSQKGKDGYNLSPLIKAVLSIILSVFSQNLFSCYGFLTPRLPFLRLLLTDETRGGFFLYM